MITNKRDGIDWNYLTYGMKEIPDPLYDGKEFECPADLRLQLGYFDNKDGYYT